MNALIFSVLTPGGIPPAQERISLDLSGVSASSFCTAARDLGRRAFGQDVARRNVAKDREAIGGHLAQLGERVEDTRVVEVDPDLRIVADGFGALGVVVEELHRATSA